MFFFLPGGFSAALPSGQDHDQKDRIRDENGGDDHQRGNGGMLFRLRQIDEGASVARFENDKTSVPLALRGDQGAVGRDEENAAAGRSPHVDGEISGIAFDQKSSRAGDLPFRKTGKRGRVERIDREALLLGEIALHKIQRALSPEERTGVGET